MTPTRPGTVGLEPEQTVLGAAAAVRHGAVSPVTLAERALDAARRAEPLNPMARLDADRALADAERLALEARDGRLRGPLHGVPLTVKDLFRVDGLPMCAGTRAPLPDVGRGEAEAEAVARLRRAGAVVVGTTNMVEVALGIHGENPWTGDVCHPVDPSRQAGGSSSGSAVAVAAGVGLASLGTDTAGSIRIPAALCGVVGAKPTVGRVPLAGALPLSPTCDHGGPLARTVADAALLLSVLAGERVRPLRPVRPRRLGVLDVARTGGLGAAVHARVDALHAALLEAGVTLVDVAPEHLGVALDAYTHLVRAEAAHVHRQALAQAPEHFSDAVRAALLAGRRLSAVDYLEARRLRDLVAAGLASVLREVDALLVPTTPVPAPRRGSAEVDVECGRVPHRDAFLRLTAPFSLVGVPAVSVPFADVDGLPLGVQVVTGRGADDDALAIAAWVESLAAAAPPRLRGPSPVVHPGGWPG